MDASPRRPLRLIAALGIAVALAGCDAAGPTPTPSPAPVVTAAPTTGPTAQPSLDRAAVYAAIEEQVILIRELERRRPVAPKALDRAGLAAYVEAEFNRENPADRIGADERLLKTLGLLPSGSSLADLYRELLTSQVVGLYSADDRELYVLDSDGNLGPTARMVFAHEFAHALQDQHFDLVEYSKAIDERGQSDRALARVSLIEGDATVVMSAWAQQNLTIDEMLKAVAEASSPAAAAALARMPPILREMSLFPYDRGLVLITAIYQSGGWGAVARAFADPPNSSEQVMHAAKYLTREEPIAVTPPEGLASRMGQGWTVGNEDTLGEFQLQLWLRGGAAAGSTAVATAAAGWGGDRVVLLDGPNGARAAALLTAWDTAPDATEFAAAAGAAVTSLGLNAEIVFQQGSSTVRVLIGSDDPTTGRLHQILGGTGV